MSEPEKNEKEHVNLDHARVPHQVETMKRIVADDRCPFCKENLFEYHTKPILHESKHWILTENFAPYEGTKKHYLLITQNHCTGFWELSLEAKLDFFAILNMIREKESFLGGTIVMRWGDTERTGASVTHLHAQLVVGASRKEGGKPILTALGYQAPNTD